MIVAGLCQCGCGCPTTIAQRTYARRGVVKGDPNRFLSRHHRRKMFSRVACHRYVLVWAPQHPRAHDSRVREHIVIVEGVIGHRLPSGAVIHHVNDQGSENRTTNLVALQNSGEHSALHRRRRVFRAGGNPWTQRICCSCKSVKDVAQFCLRAGRMPRGDCRACARARAVAVRARAAVRRKGEAPCA